MAPIGAKSTQEAGQMQHDTPLPNVQASLQQSWLLLVVFWLPVSGRSALLADALLPGAVWSGGD